MIPAGIKVWQSSLQLQLTRSPGNFSPKVKWYSPPVSHPEKELNRSIRHRLRMPHCVKIWENKSGLGSKRRLWGLNERESWMPCLLSLNTSISQNQHVYTLIHSHCQTGNGLICCCSLKLKYLSANCTWNLSLHIICNCFTILWGPCSPLFSVKCS